MFGVLRAVEGLWLTQREYTVRCSLSLVQVLSGSRAEETAKFTGPAWGCCLRVWGLVGVA